MKKLLPIFFSFLVIFSVLFPSSIHAQPAPTETPTPTPEPASGEGTWFPDSEVTFVGKAASRSDSFLNWTIKNYDWLCVTKDANDNCDNSSNPVIDFWKLIRNIMYAFLALFVLATSFIMIITRGKNITFMRFIPRFVFIFIFITLSYALVVFLFQITDAITGFFFRVSDQATNARRLINSSDLLFVGFDYSSFIGFRKVGVENDESAFISLLLVRLTAVTYYVMTGLLLIRKIILWFFVVVSPIFPILLFYSPLRNTAKIWIGEFFRWLLYAPLFAVFLHGVVEMWRSPAAIPLHFPELIANPDPRTIDPASTTQYYPTAINILLGGPGQTIDITNSVNINDTFALYVVALLMLWVVILLPFLLLKIFLDYLNNMSLGNNMVVQRIKNTNLPFIGKGFPPGSPPPVPQPPGLTQPSGIAMALPFMNKKSAVVTRVGVQKEAFVQKQKEEVNQVLKITNLSIPKMRDIARFETSLISRSEQSRTEVNRVSETLEKIANPTTVVTPIEREKITNVREKLIEERQKGNPLATQILSASSMVSNKSMSSRSPLVISPKVTVNVQLSQLLKQLANPQMVILPQEHEKITSMKGYLVDKKKQGDPLATQVLSSSEKIMRRVEKKQVINEISEELIRGRSNNVPLATTILNSGIPVDMLLKALQNPALEMSQSQNNQFMIIKQLIEKEIQNSQQGTEKTTIVDKILQSSEFISHKEITVEERANTVTKLRSELEVEKEKNSPIAITILNSGIPLDQILVEISDPNIITNPIERSKILEIKNEIEKEKQLQIQTNPTSILVQKILKASKLVSLDSLSEDEEKEVVDELVSKLTTEKEKGNEVAEKIMPQQKPETPLPIQAKLPAQNTVQQVSIEEFEEVRKMWEENYQNLDVPVGLDGRQIERGEWIQSDIDKINTTITLLNSQDDQKVKQGMEAVANILPFLLIGGFSKNEVVTYLKAKLEAAKSVMNTIEKKEEEEDTMLGRQKHEEKKEMTESMLQEIPEEEEKKTDVKP